MRCQPWVYLARGSIRNANLFVHHTTCFALVLVPGRVFVVADGHASDSDRLQGPQEATVLPPASARNVMASGAVGDTLVACLASIPADATAGQRLLAEQSCEGAEETRKRIQAAPKF